MVRVRPATQRDLAWIQRLMPVSEWEKLSPNERRTASAQTLAANVQGTLQSLLTSPQTSLLLVADVGGIPVGYMLGAIGPDSTTGDIQGYVMDLYVLPAYRRRGTAKALHQAAEQQFIRVGLRKVKIWTGLHNQAAVKLAERHGYKPEGLIGLKAW